MVRIFAASMATIICVSQAIAQADYDLSSDGETIVFSNGYQSSVTTTDCKHNSSKIIADFQQYLKEYNEPGRIVGCDMETSTGYFRVIEVDFYAGLFTLVKDNARSKVAICFNGSVGYVRVKQVGAMTRSGLVAFMMDNCGAG